MAVKNDGGMVDKAHEKLFRFQKERQAHYEKLDNYDTFGNGWTNRNNEVTARALKMAACYKKNN